MIVDSLICSNSKAILATCWNLKDPICSNFNIFWNLKHKTSQSSQYSYLNQFFSNIFRLEKSQMSNVGYCSYVGIKIFTKLVIILIYIITAILHGCNWQKEFCVLYWLLCIVRKYGLFLSGNNRKIKIEINKITFSDT